MTDSGGFEQTGTGGSVTTAGWKEALAMPLIGVDYNDIEREEHVWDGQQYVIASMRCIGQQLYIGQRVLTHEGEEGPCEGNVFAIVDYGRGPLVKIRLDWATWEKVPDGVVWPPVGKRRA